MTAQPPDRDIMEFYATGAEADRLLRGLPQLEACRTREIMSRHLTDRNAIVLDVGGGAGAYAFWLAERGHDVHLIDVSPALVACASTRNSSSSAALATCAVGDARALPQEDASVDVVLLLGPLYHLIDAVDRGRALSEAWRVLKPGGMLFASAITRWAYALHGLERDLYVDTSFADVVQRIDRDGIYQHHGADPKRFTTAYFHRPDELHHEITAAGFVIEAFMGLEGPCGMLADFGERWSNERQRADMIRVATMLESEPSLLGVSPHLLTVARKPSYL